MAGDMLRATEKAAITALKNDAGLIGIVGKASIDPYDEQPTWPFIRLDGSQAIPQGRGCTSRSEVTFLLHAFAKPLRDGSASIVETARDHAGRISNAMTEALQAHAYDYDGRRYSFTVRSTRMMIDGAEGDAYHVICSVLARVFWG